MLSNFTDSDVPDQTNKTFMITGANTGIGFETAKVLARKGARVVLGCRSKAKAEHARARILDEHPAAEPKFVELDLGDLGSVRRAATEVAQESRLDGLINNAGIMVPPRRLTKDGFESQFGVNHLGHFALTGLLLPKLEQTPGSRIVCVSSGAHRSGTILFDDLNAERSYSAMKRYSMSKIANLLFMYELDRRLRASDSSTIAVAAHPGVSDTELARHLPRLLTVVMRVVLPRLANTSAQGAWPTLLAATASDVHGGQYFGPGGTFELKGPAKRVDSNARSKDPELAQRLWDVSVALTNVNPAFAHSRSASSRSSH